MIFRNAATELENLEEAADRNVRAEVAASLAAVEHRLFGFLVGIEREANRHAISERMTADGKTDVGVAIDISEAARDIADPSLRVGQLALEAGKRPNSRVRAGERLRAQAVG